MKYINIGDYPSLVLAQTKLPNYKMILICWTAAVYILDTTIVDFYSTVFTVLLPNKTFSQQEIYMRFKTIFYSSVG